jgi:hypothetical protein
MNSRASSPAIAFPVPAKVVVEVVLMTPPVVPTAVVVVVFETAAVVGEGGGRRRDQQGAAHQSRAKDALHDRILFVLMLPKTTDEIYGPVTWTIKEYGRDVLAVLAEIDGLQRTFRAQLAATRWTGHPRLDGAPVAAVVLAPS